MSEIKNVIEMPERKESESKYIVKFSKPHSFEGKEYPSLDLSGLENLTSNDLFETSRDFSVSGYISPRPEADPQFCCSLAALVCKLPKEFFMGLPLRDGVKVRNVVQSFFQEEG